MMWVVDSLSAVTNSVQPLDVLAAAVGSTQLH